MKEEWRKVIDNENYEVSSLGRVKSLFFNKEKIIKHSESGNGYSKVNLSYDKVLKTKYIHKLVAEAFLMHKSKGMNLVVDHKNDIKTDNRLDNLQIVTQRFNTCKNQSKYISNFKGVSFNKSNNKWFSQITINKKKYFLGYFTTEKEASIAYNNKLKQI